MAIGRYDRTSVIGLQKNYATAASCTSIYFAVRDGQVSSERYIVKEGDRLDSLAGTFYGNGKYWWVIAAASGVGWNLQVPPGTYLRIPNIDQIAGLVG
jgi:nucleoid-associated protein YgaU